MMENKKKKIKIILIVILCIMMAVFEYMHFTFSKDEYRNRIIGMIMPLLFGVSAAFILTIDSVKGLYKAPCKFLFFIPALIVAVDNFPFCSYFAGKSQIINTEFLNILLFIIYCLLVGLFEEFVFRGIIFPFLADKFTHDKKGFLKAYFLSSIIFGVAHLFNLFSGAGVGATILQVGYSTLIGGLCAFVLIKTKNLILSALTHGIYDICGLILTDGTEGVGLGTGSVLDLPTCITMAIVGTIVGVFVLYFVIKYPEEERISLYARMNIKDDVKE